MATPHVGKTPVEELRGAIAATPGVVSVAPAKLNPAGNVATITVYPHSSPQAYATTQLVERLREKRRPADRQAHTGMTVYVGGVTAGAVDFADDARAQAAAVHRRRRAALARCC